MECPFLFEVFIQTNPVLLTTTAYLVVKILSYVDVGSRNSTSNPTSSIETIHLLREHSKVIDTLNPQILASLIFLRPRGKLCPGILFIVFSMMGKYKQKFVTVF
jgi:hypothetical protein